MTVRSRHRRPWRRTALAFTAVPLLYPFAWMLSVALGRAEDAYRDPYRWFHLPLRLSNFTESMRAAPFARYFLNTVAVSVATTVAVLVTSSLTGFGLAKYRFRGRQAIFVLVVASMMIPFQSLLLPLYLIVRRLGWLDTYQGLIVPFAVQGFGIFFMRQYIATIPDQLLDAARLDGASEWRVFRDIVVPATKPAVAALAIFTFLGSWNLFLWPLVVSSTPEHWTVQVGIADFFQRYDLRPELLMAATAVAMAPVVGLFLILRRFLTTGVVAGRAPR